jgi:hypothetical protein
MNLKTIFILGISCLIQFGLCAQSYSKELLKSYKEGELATFNDEQMELLNYAVDHACYLIAIPQGKDVNKFHEIQLKPNEGIIRFTDLGLKIQETTQYFKVANRQELLVVKSSNILKLERQNLNK